ncbi:MAG: DNA methyltransferase [Dehalococcoidales bacterium]
MNRVEQFGDATLYLGDCLEIVAGMKAESVDAVVSDPPYGMAWRLKPGQFCGGSETSQAKRGPGRDWGEIQNDDKPFNPIPWLGYKKVILWGCNHYAAHLPVGTTLVWIKQNDKAFGTFLSDAELAWMKGGYGVYCFRDFSMKGEAKSRVHPTQKPLPLMHWCVEKTTGTILDPFMGSGTTGVACMNLGRKFIGIEIEEKYFDIACRRIDLAARQERMAF